MWYFALWLQYISFFHINWAVPLQLCDKRYLTLFADIYSRQAMSQRFNPLYVRHQQTQVIKFIDTFHTRQKLEHFSLLWL